MEKENRINKLANKKYKLKTDVIYSGDCKGILKDSEKFPDKSIDFVITSPPYADKRKRFYGSVRPDHYVEWFLPYAKEIKRT